MRFIGSILLFTALSTAACAADIGGTWKAIFTGPPAMQPKGFSDITLHLAAEGNRLKGTAHTGPWPDGPLLDGVIDGDRIRFTLIVYSPWKNSSPSGSASGLPRLTFTGTVRDNVMEIRLLSDSVMLYGPPPKPHEFSMKAERVP